MLCMQRRIPRAVLRGLLAATGLTARLFNCGEHEFIVLQRSVPPLARGEIQNAPSVGGEVRVTGEGP